MKSLTIAVALSCVLAGRAAAQDPAWKLTPPQVKQIIDHVRAGKSLKPVSWPNGARVVVMLSFDVDNETPTLAGGRGGPAAASIGELSRGEYGARVGLQRVLDAVDRNQVPATFFIPAVSLELHPGNGDCHQEVGSPRVCGARLDSRAEYGAGARGGDGAGAPCPRYSGTADRQRPVGYRAPSWNFSQNTLRMLRELGFLYDSSLMSDDHPYELMEDNQATGIVELPVEWILTESVVFDPRGSNYSSPRDVLQVYINEFDRAWEERGMFILTTHPHIVGHRSRIIVIEKLIEHMKAKGGVWFATQRQAAEYLKQQAGR